MKSVKKRIWTLVVFLLAAFGIYMALDLLNAFGFLHLPMSNVNSDWLAIVADVLLTVGLFAATYILLNSREVRNAQNAQDAVDVMLRLTYETCQSQIAILENPELRMYAVKRTDFNAYGDGPVITSFKQAPYTHDDLIMSYVEKGLLTGQRLDEYFRIKNDYHSYVNNVITFFDHHEIVAPLEQKLKKELADAVSSLQKVESYR